MELILSILAWVAGIFAFAMLGMVMMIEMIKERESKNKNIIVFVSSILAFGLLFLGIKSIFFTSYTEVSQIHSVVASTQVQVQVQVQEEYNIGLWILYFIIFVNFYGWLFIPSKDGSNKKDILKMRPWDPNWKP